MTEQNEKPAVAEIRVAPLGTAFHDSIATAVADGWLPLGTVDRDDAIVFPPVPDHLSAWPVRPRDSFTIRFTALEDAMSGVLRSVGESFRDKWAPFREALDYVLFGMTARTSERSARKTANARRNRLRRKRARRRRRRG